MAKIEREISHNFGLEGGKKIVAALAEKLQSNFKAFITSGDWNADKTAATVKGKGFTPAEQNQTKWHAVGGRFDIETGEAKSVIVNKNK